eukprot:gene12912-17303_t
MLNARKGGKIWKFGWIMSETKTIVRANGEAKIYHVYSLGIIVAAAGGLSYWSGLIAGVWTFLFSFLFISSGYICLSLCLAEMTSMFPFSGGAYGFARVTQGTYLGYMIGCVESFEFIINTAVSIIIVAQLITVVSELSIEYEPIYWIFILISVPGLQILGGKTFWNVVTIFCGLTILSLILYLASYANYDFQNYAEKASYTETAKTATFESNLYQFILYFPFAAWFYVGFDCLPLACCEADN